uniref:Zinc finger, CCHC-type n=1 Tax=Tanacetum cinerariifolium TaxID=118510 RepID=A0A6L2MP02_TANCI|nr:zinc finger, CCHC-type [Tanacetum cinerariifolium]
MMKAMKLPLIFWAEAVRHAIYILNRVPTRALENKTPYEALYNRKLNLENLRIFRCTAYAKITIPHLEKLDDRSIPMIYLGDWDKDREDRSTQDTFRASFVVEGVDNEIATPVNIEINDNINDTYQEQDPINDPNSPITPQAYTYNPHSEEEEEATTSSTKNSRNRFDDTPVRGFKNLNEIYKNAREVEVRDLLLMEEEPRNYKEASTDEKWIEAMEIKLDSINKNNTWTLTTLPPDHKAIGLKWVYKTKRDAEGKIIKYKARLVAKGYVQEQGIDFDEDRFEMSDLGLLAYYFGIEVTQTGGEITIKQIGYINKILKETSMMDSNETKIPMDPGTKLVKAEDGNSVDATYYRSLIGSLRYLLHTRPDFSYSVRLLSRFMQDPKDHHLKAVKQVIRYIKGTKEHGIIYKKQGGCKITGYSDSSYGINTDQGKGTTGIVFYFGESPITWCTQKQPTVVLSSCESEFMVASRATCQALWLKRLLSELTGWAENRITLKVDNISAIALGRNPVFHGRRLPGCAFHGINVTVLVSCSL